MVLGLIWDRLVRFAVLNPAELPELIFTRVNVVARVEYDPKMVLRLSGMNMPRGYSIWTEQVGAVRDAESRNG